ncbi:MAG: hypothetical protein KBG75_02120 [Pseudomonadales bacterium]|nr:hypothetical protein [Pseudomonadales bacterium]
MQIKRLSIAAGELDDPGADVWRSVTGETVALMQAPPAMQPARYITTKWQNQPYGQTAKVAVKALHNAQDIAFRLEWQDPTKNEQRAENTDFPDAVALLFPLAENASLFMGTPEAPVSLWHWRADHPTRARCDIATGIGTSRVMEGESLSARSTHQDGRWSVVIRRALQVQADPMTAIQFTPGQVLRSAFAVWEGGNQERAGIKAFSPAWLDLKLEA